MNCKNCPDQIPDIPKNGSSAYGRELRVAGYCTMYCKLEFERLPLNYKPTKSQIRMHDRIKKGKKIRVIIKQRGVDILS